MTKAEIVAKIAESAGITKKEADAVLRAFVEAMHELFKKEEMLRIPGQGSSKKCKERKKSETGRRNRNSCKKNACI